MTGHQIAEVAHQIEAVPLVWLVLRAIRGCRDDPFYWWLGISIWISWVADWAGHADAVDFAGMAYPISQVGIAAAVFLARRDAIVLSVATVLAGLVAVMLDRDAVLYVVGYGGLCAALLPRRELGLKRDVMLLFFGVNLVGFLGFHVYPSATMWYLWHVPPALAVFLFCYATVEFQPRLRVIRT